MLRVDNVNVKCSVYERNGFFGVLNTSGESSLQLNQAHLELQERS